MNRAVIIAGALVVVAGAIVALLASDLDPEPPAAERGVTTGAPAAPAPPTPAPPAAAADAGGVSAPVDGWRRVAPPGEPFTAELPDGEITASLAPRTDTTGVPVIQGEWSSLRREASDHFAIVRTQLWRLSDPARGLDGLRDLAQAQTHGGPGRTVAELKEVESHGVAGLEVAYRLESGESGGMNALMRWFPVGGRLYQVIAVVPDEGKARARRFVDAFSFTDAVKALLAEPAPAWAPLAIEGTDLTVSLPGAAGAPARTAELTPWGKGEVETWTVEATAPKARVTVKRTPLGAAERGSKPHELIEAWQQSVRARLPSGATLRGPRPRPVGSYEGRVLSSQATGERRYGLVVGDAFVEVAWTPAAAGADPEAAARMFESLRAAPAAESGAGEQVQETP